MILLNCPLNVRNEIMVVNTDVVLAQPEAAYGAVFGRKQKNQNRRYVIFGFLVAIWAVAAPYWFYYMVFQKDEITETISMYLGFTGVYTFGLLIIGMLGLFQSLLFYNKDVYDTDVYNGRREYAETVFKAWFQSRYDVKISEEEAYALFDGYNARLWRDTGVPGGEKVLVRFEYSARNFSRFTRLGRGVYSEGSTPRPEDWAKYQPETETVEFRLMIIEEPKAPRIYLWT